jgi:hypothetical protein
MILQNVSHDGTAVATSPFDVSVFEDLDDLDNSILVEDLDKPLYSPQHFSFSDSFQTDFPNKERKRKRTENEN